MQHRLTPSIDAGQLTYEQRLDAALALQAQARRQRAENLASIRRLKLDLDTLRDNMRAVRDHLLGQCEEIRP
jgi:hypothetical protein